MRSRSASAESSPTSIRCSISMPNGVPQSPTWLSLITWWPANSSTRAMASPTMVVRRCPTCISLAMLGEEYSTTTVCGAAAGSNPSRGSSSMREAWAAIQSSRSRKLMKPGPLTSGGSHTSATSRWPASSPATSRGGRPSRLPSGSATLAWKSANEEGRISGSASPKSGPNDADDGVAHPLRENLLRIGHGSRVSMRGAWGVVPPGPAAYRRPTAAVNSITGGGGNARRGSPSGRG